MKIPLVDLGIQYRNLKPSIDAAITAVLQENAFIGGKYVQEFEQAFARMYGVKHVISCANGTDSLYIIMKMSGIAPGDEVITVANSWISSAETITQTGAKVVFVDVENVYGSMDVEKLEAAITPNTKAVIAVHLQGQLCAMKEILALCEKNNLLLIEDCAQSHFSAYGGQLAGLMGVAGSFSFYPGKNLGAYGDAGCIITNDDALAEKCRMYANHGALQKHKHRIEGINSRMDGLQAAVLSAKLPFILEWTEKRINNATYYNTLLTSVSEVILPKVRPGTKHSFHLYVIRAKQRDALAANLREKGIETAIHYPVALPNLEAYKYLGHQPADFPVAGLLQQEILSLPMYPELTKEMMEYIATSIKNFYTNVI